MRRVATVTAGLSQFGVRVRAVNTNSTRLVGALAVSCVLIAACTSDDTDRTAPEPTTSAPSSAAPNAANDVDQAIDLLPADTRGVFAVDIAALNSNNDADEIADLLSVSGAAPMFGDVFRTIASLAPASEMRDISTALLVQTTDPDDQFLLLAEIDGAEPEDAIDDGNRLVVLPGGVLVAGRESAVASALDAANGDAAPGSSSMAPYLDALGDADVSFAYGLPGLFDDVDVDRSFRGAAVISGQLDIADGDLTGEVSFHTPNAATFVESFNSLDRHGLGAPDSTLEPLVLAESGDDTALDRVVITLPSTPLDPTPEQAVELRNVFKKLLVGMEAHEYAEQVVDDGAPWFDLVVKSEADGDDPPSPASVFFRWEFRDDAARAAFEENELPEGFRLAPTRFFESDDPEGQYFFLLNLYNAGGGSIVGGARAEWDVYVYSPEGGPDPNPGERPRFFVVDALAESVSFDSVNLVTPAEPLSHDNVDGVVTSSVQRVESDGPVPVWTSTFPAPDPTESDVARFTREMAIGNDFIYWGYGAADRVLYNATTFNHDAYFVDPADVDFVDNSRWAQYLDPELVDVVYYENTLDYVVSPLTNLESDQLDITPEWREELLGFANNGHQEGLMRKAVEQLFRGQGDPMVGYRVSNTTPSAYYHFEVTDPDRLTAAIDLPAGHALAPTTIFEGGAEAHYLTLSVVDVDGALDGPSAEWSVYTDTGDGRPKQMVLDRMTADVAFDPVEILALPDVVDHAVDGDRVETRLSSGDIEFVAGFATSAASRQELSMDWVETGDVVCRLNGICDALYYDAETLDVPVGIPSEVSIESFSTPWDDFIETTPAAVFFRDNAQDYAIKRWFNLDVAVDELPFSGLENATHTITGTGTLDGQATDVVDSVYRYTGDAVIEDDKLLFAIDQEIDNALGVGNIYTTGSFDLTTGTGTQTVVDCLGPALLCSDVVNGATSIYTAGDLDASDPDEVSWRVDLTVLLSGSFGSADSASGFVAQRTD